MGSHFKNVVAFSEYRTIPSMCWRQYSGWVASNQGMALGLGLGLGLGLDMYDFR